MINSLKLKNVGPKDNLELKLGTRLNIFTGDNGLGKSFLLDIIWWALTRTWPNDINSEIVTGYLAKPRDMAQKKEAKIEFNIIGKTGKPKKYSSTYDARDETWSGRQGRPINPGLVIYTMSDGSFALWDPARNYWKQKGGIDIQERVPAYVYTQKEIWDGQIIKNSNNKDEQIFEGLVRDWSFWQIGNTEEFRLLKELLKSLSPENELLEPGELTRIRLDDGRKIPTIKMPYGKEVPLYHLSSGVRRIITLCYFLVYAWQEHRENARLLGEEPTKQIIFLIDEIEAHLHPKWQRQIIPTLLNVMTKLVNGAQTQLITATHSPLIMASLEPIFDPVKDLWVDFDLKDGLVEVKEELFEKFGSINNWLESEAFNLKNSYAFEYEKLIEEAKALISSKRKAQPTKDEIESMRKRLSDALSPTDEFLFYWRSICEKKGYLPHVTSKTSS
ncbi:hypothetical protein C3Z13_00335 [Avibacterium endocarditidis]|uniref:ATPase AAA-type core domain-containing protein n=2 Tax=Avibacterium endocarditidis TaxID=380674 RepID=A0ABX4ZUF4_9PAST|nr:hypothetical protein C3Z13_00335 [Avibacterium endocarditidis]